MTEVSALSALRSHGKLLCSDWLIEHGHVAAPAIVLALVENYKILLSDWLTLERGRKTQTQKSMRALSHSAADKYNISWMAMQQNLYE